MSEAIKFSIPGTSAAVSDEFKLVQAQIPGLLVSKGVAGVETVKLQGTTDDGATFVDLTDENGSVELIGVTRNSLPIKVAGRFRLSKSATASAVVVVALSFGTTV